MPQMIHCSDLGSSPSADVAPAVESSIRSLPGKGEKLSPSERSFFEPRFGADFSGVRLHSGTPAGELTTALQARAFTVGSDIVMGPGQYSPGTSEGRRLLGHELTHVVQQGVRQSGTVPRIQRQGGTGGSATAGAEEPDHFSYNPALDPELKKRFNRMVGALKAKGISYDGKDDVRPRKRAHILSTAYHLHDNGGIPLSDLQALSGGMDSNGNAWYDKAWETVPTWGGFGSPRPATNAEIWSKVKENAFAKAKHEGSG